MTTLATRRTYWTVADLDDLPEEEGLRYEIINGELLVSTTPELEHQWVMVAIATALNAWALPRRAGKAFVTPGVIFTDADNVIPDVAWVSKDREQHIRRNRRFYGAPELMVEILSPGTQNEQRDRLQKLQLYEAQGVQEYWLVDWRTRQITVYRRADAGLHLAATLGATDRLTSPLLPDFGCIVGELFEPE